MATLKNWNNTNFQIPDNLEARRTWGQTLSTFLKALADNALSRYGGSFNITGADINFGSSYGLVLKYVKSVSSNISATGVVRVAHGEAFAWRDFGNSADLPLTVDAANELTFNGVKVASTYRPTFTSYAAFSAIVKPSAPSAGTTLLYTKADGKMYRLDNSDRESAVGGGLVPTAISAAATVSAGTHYLVDTSSAGFTLTLPAGTPEAAIRFSDARETWDTNNLTIAPATGEIIDNLSASETLVCDVKRGWVELSWNGSRWVLSSLASTQIQDASATQAGQVTTGTQTIAGAKTFTGRATFSGGVGGRTSGATVPAGDIGEIKTSSFSATPLTTATNTNVATLSLEAGVWLVYYKPCFTHTTTAPTTITNVFASISIISATLYNPGMVADVSNDNLNQARYLGTATRYLNLAATTTVYAVMYATFSGGSGVQHANDTSAQFYAVRIFA